MARTIGEKIRKYRKEKGLTQKELGKLSGIAYKQIGHYEQERATPNFATMAKIAKALDIPPLCLMLDVEETLNDTEAESDDVLIVVSRKEHRLLMEEHEILEWEAAISIGELARYVPMDLLELYSRIREAAIKKAEEHRKE